jgi:futalosine hydrolase
MHHPLALVCSVALEAAPLLARLEDAMRLEIGRKPATSGTLDGAPVLVLEGGMGKANAAHALTALLETRAVRGVIGFGVGGAYSGSGLEVGGVALASEEIYGDEGVETPAGWISTEGIGIALLERAGGERCFNHFALPAARVAAAEEALRDAGIAASTGPFVTVSACSGTASRGAVLADRFGAICENMEGAALAHLAALYEVPFLEVRGISNAVEDRDLSRWRLHDAAAASADAAAVLVRSWADTPTPASAPAPLCEDR